MSYYNTKELGEREDFANIPGSGFAETFVIPSQVTRLETSFAYLRSVIQPTPHVTHLSIRLWGKDFGHVHRWVALFHTSLRSLRLRVKCSSPFQNRHDSPARLCERLNMWYLEYLEIQEESSIPNPGYPPGHVDRMIEHRIARTAREGTPELRHLVWRPTWSYLYDQDILPGGLYHDTVAGFRQDLLHVLSLKSLIFMFSQNRYMRFVPSNDPQYVIERADGSDSWWQSI